MKIQRISTLVAVIPLLPLLAGCPAAHRPPASDTGAGQTPDRPIRPAGAPAEPSAEAQPRRPRGAPPDPAAAARAAAAQTATPFAAEVDRLMAAVMGSRPDRSAARKALIALGLDTTPELARYLSSPEFTLRWEAVNVMGYVEDPRAADPLFDRVLHDDNPHVRWRSLWALGNIPEPGIPERFRLAIASETGEASWRAVIGASMFGVEECLPALHAKLKESDDGFKSWEAVNALGRIFDASSPAALTPVLETGDTRLRREAVMALGKMRGHRLALELLLNALEDPDPQLRWRAAMGLKSWPAGDTRGPAERRLAIETDPETRKHLERLLH